MKTWHKILISLSLLLFLLFGGIWATVHYYSGDIKNYVITSINKQLKTKVDVKEVNISFWKSFPQTAVVFNGVVIYEVDSEKDTLLYAKSIATNFSLKDLYFGNYELKGLKIENGFCRMMRYTNKETNYIFWEESISSKEEKEDNFSINLKKVNLNNIFFEYTDSSNALEMSFLIDDMELSGNFKNDVFDMQIKSVLKQSFIQNADFTFVKDKTLFLYTLSTVDNKKEAVSFTDANLGIEGMNFALKGKVNYSDQPHINFILRSTNTELRKAIELLPSKIKESFADFKIYGDAEINGSIDGALSSIEQPSFHFSFIVNEGRFEQKKNNIIFKDSYLKGTIHNGDAHTPQSSIISVENIKTNFNGGNIEGKISIENFEKPQYQFVGKMNFELKDAITLFKWEDLKQVTGKVDAHLNLFGQLESIDNYSLQDWKNSTIKGQIKLEDIGFYYSNGPQYIHQINGTLQLQNNNVDIRSLVALVDESQVKIQGSFNNLIGYLIEPHEILTVDAKLNSSNIQLEDFLAANPSQEDTTEFLLKVSPQLKIKLQTDIEKLSFKKFTLNHLKADFVVNQQQISSRNINFQTLGGNVKGDLFIRENVKDLSTFAQFSIQKINIKELFYVFDNFDQQTLISDNLEGIATADIEYSCQWSKNLVADLSTLTVSSNIFIEKGELNNFKPLESLSSFVALDELKRVKFSNLQNQILIKDQTIFIPNFDVNSSALNIGIKGKHLFDNHIDYSFTLLLNEILSKKVRKPKSNEFGYVEDDGLGRTKLFIKMTGTIDHPKFSYDKEALKEHLKTEVDKEKKTIKSMLNQEFGLYKRDTSLQQLPKTPESKSLPFEIEWDEEKHEEVLPSEERLKSIKKEEKKQKEKGKLGKFFDKHAQPNEEEYE